jgi:hypothetical protein
LTAEIHVDDVGTVFKATIKDEDGTVLDVSGASSIKMVFHPPDGQNFAVDASFFTNGQDGIVKYTTIANDIDQPGIWEVQGFTYIGTSVFHSDIHKFNVYPNLVMPN